MKKTLAVLTLMAGSLWSYGQLINATSNDDNNTCATTPVVNNIISGKRFGHELTAGVFGSYAIGAGGAWSAIGTPNIFNTYMTGGGGVSPSATNLYGYFSQWETDRAFFGLQRIGSDRADATIAWGDNIDDRLVFKFYGNTGNCATGNNTASSIHEWATMLANGNFGLGVSNPLEQFHTTLGVRFDGVAAQAKTNWTRYLTIDNNGVVHWNNAPSLGCTTANILPKVDPSNTSNQICSQVSDDGTSVSVANATPSFWLTNSFGPLAPKFFVDMSTSNGVGAIVNGGSTGPVLGFSSANTTSRNILGAAVSGVMTSNASGTETMDMFFSTKPSSSGMAERMRILSNGNVGIGTSAPSTALHVNGQSVWLSGGNGGSLPAAAGKGLRMLYSTSDDQSEIFSFDYNAFTSKNLVLQLSDVNKSFVGIGTGTNPLNDKLDVNGTVRVENLPATTSKGIVMYGDGSTGVTQTNQLHSLAFTTADKVLHGDGTWGAGGGVAENGLSNDPATGNVVLGQADCPDDATDVARLLSDRFVPLNGHNLNFMDSYDDDYSAPEGKVSIGLCDPTAKLDIYKAKNIFEKFPTGLRVLNADQSTLAITSTTPYNMAVGADINTTNDQNKFNIGGHMTASNSVINQGVVGEGINGTLYQANNSGNPLTNYLTVKYKGLNTGGTFFATGNSFENAGVVAYASDPTSPVVDGIVATGVGGNSAYGGRFEAAGGASTNYGLVATYTGTQNATNCAGVFFGNCYSSGVLNPSDENLKENIKVVDDVLPQLRKLQINSYTFKNEQYKNMNLPAGDQVGLLAKNLQSVYPNLVQPMINPASADGKNPETKFLAVNYVGLVPVLVQAVKELDTKTEENNSLKADLAATNATVAALQKQLDDICNSGCAGLRGSNATDAATTPGNVLMQNVPNPFSGQTTIGYVVNTGTLAYMNVNALDGKLIRRIDLATKGQGNVTINATEMSAGTYTYSLYVDEKVIDTKLMVISSSK